MKICKDGRIWGQNNKEAKDHLGILMKGSSKNYVKKGYNPNSAHKGKKINKEIHLLEKICKTCGKKFLTAPSRIKTGRGKFCSRKCVDIWSHLKKKKKNNPHWQGGHFIKKNCLTCGKEFSARQDRKERSKFCSKSCRTIHTVLNMKKSGTSIELKVEEILKKLGIQYESQKVIPEGRTIGDFYIPKQRLVIYCDGTYWHSLLGRARKDNTQDLILNLNGYQVLRLSENDIKNNIKNCSNRIQKQLKE